MTNTDGVAREAAARAKVAQRRREAQVVRDRENRHAFLRGYWAAMCRRNCWAYNARTGEDERRQVSPQRLSWRALVGMARTAESFRRAQYVHLDAAARQRTNRSGWPESDSWRALGDAFGVGRDLQTMGFLKMFLGDVGETLQRAALEYGRAGLLAVARKPQVDLDDYYEDENGEAKG